MPAPSSVTPGTTFALSDGRGMLVARYPDLSHPRVLPGGQNPSLSGDGQLIAIDWVDIDRADTEEKFAVCDTRTGKVLATHSGFLPRVSHDGRLIAFTRTVGKDWSLYVIDSACRGQARPLAASGFAPQDTPRLAAHWTGTGLIVAYTGEPDRPLYVLRPDGKVIRQISLRSLNALDSMVPFGCALSDDFQHLVFERPTLERIRHSDGTLSDARTGLFLYETVTRRLRQITPKGLGGCNPVWYDAQTILFAGEPNRLNAEMSIYALPIQGGPARLITSGTGDFAVAKTRNV